MTAVLLPSNISVALLLHMVAGALFTPWRCRATACAKAPDGMSEVVAGATPPGRGLVESARFPLTGLDLACENRT